MSSPRRVPALLAGIAVLSTVVVGTASPVAAAPTFPAPAWSVTTGDIHLSSPTLADVNGDGVKDVAIATLAGMLHILDGRTGAALPGWPQPVQPRAGFTTAVESSPTVADLDNDGIPEIAVGAGSLDVVNQPGGFVVFNRNGSVRWRQEGGDKGNVWNGSPVLDGFGDGVVGTAAAGDVDGDGFKDIVYGSFDNKVYVKNRAGGDLPGFPFDNTDTIWSSPALFDNDGDGRLEIYIGGDANGGFGCRGGVVHALSFLGTAQRRWTVCRGEIFQSSPAIGDIDSDGRNELVIGGGLFWRHPDGSKVFAFHLDDGSPVPGWPQTTNGPVFGSPVIGDVSGDGAPDVVVTACAQCAGTGRVWAFRGTGSPLWNVDPATAGLGTELISTPILTDLNGDGVNDVAVGGGSFFFLRGQDGSRLYEPVAQARAHQNSAGVADIGGGVGWRLVVASRIPGQPGRVDAFPLPVAPASTPAWPVWRRSSDHVGAPPSGGPVAPATAGYWLAASDGGIFAFGNAPFFGSTGAIRLNQPIVGMAGSPSGQGYWLVASDGGIFAFGDAGFVGSTGAIRLNQPIVGMASTPSGRGYWLVARDGGIFAFGDAGFFGSTGAIRLNQPIVGMAGTPSGRGYWLVASDGGIFNFGDAGFLGSTGAIRLNQPIVGMGATLTGRGYRLVARDGGIFAFGDGPFQGSTGAIRLNQPIIGMAPPRKGGGYWLAASDGGIFAFGGVGFFGSTGGLRLNRPIVAVAASQPTA